MAHSFGSGDSEPWDSGFIPSSFWPVLVTGGESSNLYNTELFIPVLDPTGSQPGTALWGTLGSVWGCSCHSQWELLTFGTRDASCPAVTQDEELYCINIRKCSLERQWQKDLASCACRITLKDVTALNRWKTVLTWLIVFLFSKDVLGYDIPF